MKLNINDLAKLSEIKEVLAEKNVSPSAISTIEKALKTGMVFKKPEDLAILNISVLDLGVVGQAVDFGTTTVVVKNIKTIEYTFKPIGEEKFFFGYQLIVTYTNRESFTIEQSYPIEDTRAVIVDLDLNDLLDNSKVSIQVKSAQGKHARIALNAGNNEPKEDLIEVDIPALANATINVGVDALAHLPNPPIKGSYQIKGKLISNRGDAKLDGYQIVIYAATVNLQDGTPDFLPVAFAKTETNGYFVSGFLIFNNPDDINNVKAGKAIITKDELKIDQPIRLIEKTEGGGEITVRKSMLPDRLILVINESNGEKEGCKDCGCSDLNFHEKKVLEEFSYYTVVRTTEPSIIADVLEEEKEINLEDIYGINISVPFSVFQKFHAIESKQIKPANFLNVNPAIFSANPSSPVISSSINAVRSAVNTTTAGTAPALGELKPAFNKDLLDKLVIEHKVKTIIKGNAKAVFKGRTHLNQLNQIDWDDEPTIYQAASIAHGHLLHFKQEWIPDGYSIGDLIYSLPLAPGQKKQIAVLDWERRESAANSQFLGYEETLNNSLVRDRDINEIVSATLTENIRGNSKASTGGIGFGLGSSVMGIIPGVGTFGSLLGISGGTSSSGSTASQNSNRESTANSLQSITDRTMQAASVVRSQRSTVVQTVSQGERVQATAESVANYNHCHAITIQYFEVLRHFAVRNRLAGVQECLFVPLQMTPFDLEKCLRWRNTLEKHLYRRELRAAFEAVARIQKEKESPFENYYDSIGFPRKNFAEQNINFYSGDLFMEFFFFNTKEAKIDDEIILFFSFFGISLDGFRDKKITDEELANHVGPRAIEYLLDAFTIETDKGVDLRLDLTLINTFRQNANLRISVRQASNTPVNIARNQIDGINIKLDLDKLSEEESKNLKQFQNKFLKIRVRSGSLRYRTDNFSGSFFEGRLDNDIFAGGDGVFVRTPLTKDELRNPRGEDVDAANDILHHLNENLEYYHKCLFFDMTAERRFMLLDGIIAPGKANGRSVASVVENKVIGIAGNSLIMPVAPGNQLDPTIDETFDLFAQYYQDEQEPMRISMPTKGIYAEAVMGKCNSCEEKDESRFWRWEESPIPDSPNTQILPLNTDTRRAEPGNLQPKDFPSPVVNIQNASNVPDPTGLQNMLQLIGKADSFRDITGLNQNQLNALATFQKTMDTAQAFGKEAGELAKAAAEMKMVEDAKKSGTISNDQAKEKGGTILDQLQKDPNVSKLEKGLGLIDQLEKEGKITPETSAQTKNSLLKNFLDSSNAKTPMSNGELQNLSDVANKNNTDISVERPDGEKVDIKKQVLESGIGGNTQTHTINIPNLADHEGYGGRFRYRLTLNGADFKVELINESFDFINVGPIHARNESNLTLKAGSPQFGDSIPCNPRSTTILYEGSLNAGANPADFVPGAIGISIGIETTLTKSDLKFSFPFAAGMRIPCIQGQNIGTHTGASKFAVDLGVPRGVKVLAAMNGIVVDVVKVHPNMPIGTRGSANSENLVRIRHDDLSYGIYGHLDTNAVDVSVGQKVAKGDVIGKSGNSGNSNGDHLHYAIEKATPNNWETIEWDFYDNNSVGYIPETGKIYESKNGLVTGKYTDDPGDPEGNVVGDVGDIYGRLDGSPGSMYYVKKTGGNGTKTGWVAKATFP